MNNKDFNFNSLVKADPDFFIVEPVRGDDNKIDDVELIPVVAWAMYQNILPIPVTITGVCDPDNYVLLLPDKRVMYALGEFDSTVQDWISEENKRRV